MHSVGKFLTHFRRLGLQGFQVGGDEGYGHQLMDRMVEEGFYLQRINNGSPAKRSDIYTNIFSECWSIVGQRSVQDMGLKVGDRVAALVKATNVSPMPFSNTDQLQLPNRTFQTPSKSCCPSSEISSLSANTVT
jgi:molybdopterin-binding protein